MAPAVLTIVVLVVVSRRIGAPAALTKPFDRAG
jgi:simple sugar transport system permease protein